MSVPTLLAVSSRWEAELAAGLDGHDEVSVVRRCVDLADLLAAAGAGLARAAVVSGDLDGLDADVLHRLRRSGVATVVMLVDDRSPGADAAHVVASTGRAAVLPADCDPREVAAVVLAAASPEQAGVPADFGRGVDQHPGYVGLPQQAAAPPLVPARPAPPLPGEHPSHPYGPPGAQLPPLDAGDSFAGLTDEAWDAAFAWPSGPPPQGPPPTAAPAAPAPEPVSAPLGRESVVVAVWGPAGAPGRTTVAVTLAAELAAAGEQTLLVDADTYAAAVSPALGLLDEGSGLASAVRAASNGRLDLARLAALAPVLSPQLRVLTGLPTSRRWHELRPAGLEAVWALSRELAAWTVIDCSSCLETDEDLMYDTAAPRRNQATLSALEAADVVLVVGAGDPIGLQRLVRGLQELAEVVPGKPVRVVVNKVRGAAVGGSPERRVREALERFAPVTDPVLVPDDRDACDSAILAGRSLTEHAPGSPARQALAGLARQWVGVAGSGTTRSRRRGSDHGRRRAGSGAA